MDISTEKYMKRLNEILRKKFELLGDIYDLTAMQASSINEEGIEGLQKLVDRKQEKIDAVDRLDEEFNVYFQRLKSVLKVDSLSELNASGIDGAKEIKETVSDILAKVKEISGLESSNNTAAKKLLDEIGGEVKKLNQGKKVSNAYSPGSVNTTSYFIDKKK